MAPAAAASIPAPATPATSSSPFSSLKCPAWLCSAAKRVGFNFSGNGAPVVMPAIRGSSGQMHMNPAYRAIHLPAKVGKFAMKNPVSAGGGVLTGVMNTAVSLNEGNSTSQAVAEGVGTGVLVTWGSRLVASSPHWAGKVAGSLMVAAGSLYPMAKGFIASKFTSSADAAPPSKGVIDTEQGGVVQPPPPQVAGGGQPSRTEQEGEKREQARSNPGAAAALVSLREYDRSIPAEPTLKFQQQVAADADLQKHVIALYKEYYPGKVHGMSDAQILAESQDGKRGIVTFTMEQYVAAREQASKEKKAEPALAEVKQKAISEAKFNYASVRSSATREGTDADGG